MPELRQLRYFVAVAEELNFSRAAERLHMAQPPLSVAIRQLEQELGTSLFVRTSREVRLTEAGVALLDGARRTLAEAEAAMVSARRAAAGEVGSLRIGYNWSARFDTLPALGQAFKRGHPDVELLAEEMRPNHMRPALRAGAIDVALALYPEVVAGLSYQTVRREPIVAVLSATHPLAREDRPGLEALADEFLLSPRELAPRLHDFYVGLCRQAGFEPKHSSESSRTRWTVGTWEASTAALLPEFSCRRPTRRCRCGAARRARPPARLAKRQRQPGAGRVRRPVDRCLRAVATGVRCPSCATCGTSSPSPRS
jgi:LysR family transcriptional regulator, benzoate and cis,cis-muconate-responsive activator of ben and cat genes